jgi:hypothetical protein
VTVDVRRDADGGESGVEAVLGDMGVLLTFPFSAVDFWDTWEGLCDTWRPRVEEEELDPEKF